MAKNRRETRDDQARAVLAQAQIVMLPRDWSTMRGRWSDLLRFTAGPVAA